MATDEKEYGRWVEVSFDCLPLRSVADFSVPDDASPKLAAKLGRIRSAFEKHGAYNTYYLHNATCIFHLTNDPSEGMMQYGVEGTVLTDEQDMAAKKVDLSIQLQKETCSWLNQSIVDWLAETAQKAVQVEFDRFIKAGDLSKTIARIEEIQQASEDSGGFVGMYL